MPFAVCCLDIAFTAVIDYTGVYSSTLSTVRKEFAQVVSVDSDVYGECGSDSEKEYSVGEIISEFNFNAPVDEDGVPKASTGEDLESILEEYTNETPDASPQTGAKVSPQSADPPHRTTAQKIKRKLMQISILLAFLLIVTIGLMIMLYPQISNYVNTKNASRVISGYEKALDEVSEVDYTAYIEEARAYNARLAGTGVTVRDAFSQGAEDVDKQDVYWKLLDVVGDGTMGFIEIEILDIKLPLYHGTSEIVLARGAGHIHGSSLPIGGESTHAVISAHTGLPSAKLFTGIDQLKPGDTFTLHILKDVLTYEVNQTKVVLHNEINDLAIVKGEDYVTLITCTPYGINSHRLLVRGTRIETQVNDVTEQSNDVAEPEITAVEEPGWVQKAINSMVEFFSIVVEKVAGFLVRITEWGMDIFGVEYS